ncbi:hypothetical protein MBAV_001042 [Candidatus Magnetobacterium bavaricum]|uniref:Uncharacterized protein n=1 Tax=Candidatus Magnetobacterium bavaricum TaxID=29290 RepID=A0A0F3H1I2_9BACT|nr:hypothetical protein MBAV_001042 [Candidatus Magnetobacterium bavaricum]
MHFSVPSAPKENHGKCYHIDKNLVKHPNCLHGKFVLRYNTKRKDKKEGGSAPSSDLPCKGASPLDPIIAMVLHNISTEPLHKVQN